MGKVSIKKNVKPKTIKQKQKQTQKTNVTVNIGSISKKRGRPKRQVVKKPVQQPTSQPIVSYNQPIFKQSNPQPSSLPSSLASSILATQSTPKAVAEEVKNESSIKKALQEQVTNIDTEPEKLVNDLERTRRERIKKFEKPIASITPEIPVVSFESDPLRKSLLSQRLADQGDDTEEISLLTSSNSLFRPIEPIPQNLSRVQQIKPTPLSIPFQFTPPKPLSNLFQPSEETNYDDLPELEEPPELNFGGVEESKDSEPPEPEPTILEPVPPPPTILEPVPPPPTILEPVQPPQTILEPENQIVVRKPQKVGQTSTATQETNIRNPIDGSIPSFLRPLNNPLPTVYLKDIVGQRPTEVETREIRQARIKALDKPRLLAIEPQTAQGEAEDTIKMLENLLNPNKKNSTPFSKEEFEGYKSYTKQVGEAEKAAEEGGVTNLDKQQTPEFLFEQKLDSMTNLQLGKLLKDNNLKGESGNDFRITSNKQIYDGKQFMSNSQLKKNLLTAFKGGYLTNLEEN